MPRNVPIARCFTNAPLYPRGRMKRILDFEKKSARSLKNLRWAGD